MTEMPRISWQDLPRPIMCLAPMDGVTNTAYRQIVRRFSLNVILFSEFTNVDGILRSHRVRQRLDYDPCEHPFLMQLFGNTPESFAEVSRMVEDRGIFGVDINMGCPSKKIVHSQHGSALMKDPGTACRIIEAIRKACSLEVSVKTRLGWNDASQLISFAQALESAGASMLTIHGRTYNQAFRGEANWDPIYELKNNIQIPLIGNGDVEDYADGLRRQGNLDGFMIGRAAIGNPWCFREQVEAPEPTVEERITVTRDHYLLLRQIRDERHAVKEIRKYLGGYLSNFRQAKEWRTVLMGCTNEASLLEALDALEQGERPSRDALLKAA